MEESRLERTACAALSSMVIHSVALTTEMGVPVCERKRAAARDRLRSARRRALRLDDLFRAD